MSIVKQSSLAVAVALVFGLSMVSTPAQAKQSDVWKGLGAAALIYGVSQAARHDRHHYNRHHGYYSAREACYRSCERDTYNYREYRRCIHWRRC